ncbi:hypothetical protein CWO89_25375 [Bradyrhizobium sp. Leo170]|nr:hypothetical protein CWO89_25375 [Bradyrhizobium sp. Leo170]
MAEPFRGLFSLADHQGFHHQNIFKIYSLRRILRQRAFAAAASRARLFVDAVSLINSRLRWPL